MNENQIADIWMLMKEYLDKKAVTEAAERYVDLLADHGISDKAMEAATGFDEHLDTAIEYYLDQDSIESDDGDEEDFDSYEEDE
jgi:hypothetical protein